MKRLKTKTNYLLLVVLALIIGMLVLVLAACGGGEKPESEQQEQESAQTQTKPEAEQSQAEPKEEVATKDPLAGSWKAFAYEYAGITATFEELIEETNDASIMELAAYGLTVTDDSRISLLQNDEVLYEGTLKREGDALYMSVPGEEKDAELVYDEANDTLALDTPYGDIVMKRA